MLLFVGNFLTIHGYNPTFMELLAGDLGNKYNIHCVSNKKNKVVRLIDMCLQFYNNLDQIKLVVLDTYSTNAYYFVLVISLLSRIHNKPYILILSGGNLEIRLKKSPLFHSILKHSSENIAPSKFLYDIFNNYDYEISYLPNYIDLNLYPYLYRPIIKPKILWVRSFHKIYNPQMAILVLKNIIYDYPEAKLCMVGPQKDHSIDLVKDLIKNLGLKKNVIITGILFKKDWIKLSKDYNIFINTTNYDNHPVTLLEAMALGLPIVSTNVGGIPSFLTHDKTAKLVKRDDVNSMASCIIEFISNGKQSEQIILNARNVIENDFNKKNILSKWFLIIDQIVQK